MASSYRLTTSPVENLQAALADLQSVLDHIANYPGVSLVGVSVLGTVVVTTDNPIPADQVVHLNLTEL